VLGGTAFVDDYLARLKTITADDLKRVAGLYFTGKGYAAAVVEPRSLEEP
jgi:predicted Zn-dependent peptidase